MHSYHTSPISSLWQPAAPPASSDSFPAGRSYLLWNFTLTFRNPCSAGNTKSNFPIRKHSSHKDNRLPCHPPPPKPPPNPGDKLQHWKEQQFAARAPAPQRPYDPILQYQTLRRWGKPVSSASLSGYHPPTGRENTTRRVLGKAEHLPRFNIVLGLTTVLTKYKSNLRQSDNSDRGAIRCNWIRILLEKEKWRVKNRFHASNTFFYLWITQVTLKALIASVVGINNLINLPPCIVFLSTAQWAVIIP